jgi:hypothetical protein
LPVLKKEVIAMQLHTSYIDFCNVCQKKLKGRGTKYRDKNKMGYLCREHAKEQGTRVFVPFRIKGE